LPNSRQTPEGAAELPPSFRLTKLCPKALCP